MTDILSRNMYPTQFLVRNGREKIDISILQRPRYLVVDQISILKKMAVEKWGSEFMRKFELQVAPRVFVTPQELEAFGKWAIGG